MQDFYASGDAAADICRSFLSSAFSPTSTYFSFPFFLSSILLFSASSSPYHKDGFDNYPQGFDCSHPTVWAPVEPAYAPYHARVNGKQPLYIPEFQGGAFDAWGPGSPGYGKCEELTGRAFESGEHCSFFAPLRWKKADLRWIDDS